MNQVHELRGSPSSPGSVTVADGLRRATRRTIRWTLMRDLLVTVLLLFLSFVLLTIFAGRRAVMDLADLAVERTMDQVSAELGRFVDPVAATMAQVSRWWDDGFVDVYDEGRLTKLLEPIFARTEQLSAIILADDAGRALMIYRSSDGSGRLASRVQDAQARTVRWRDDARGEHGETERWLDKEHDLRTRPWFHRATALLPEAQSSGPAGIVGWTEPYVFLTQARPGITGARAQRGPSGELRVVAADVLLDAVNDFTQSLSLGARGQVAILSDDGLVIGHPRDADLGASAIDGANRLRSAKELDLPLVVSPDRMTGSTGVRRFSAAGEPWWGEVAVHPIGEADRLLVAIAIPEEELLRGFSTLRTLVVMVTAVILAGAVGRSLWLAARFSRPIRGLLVDTERFSHGDLAPGPPLESDMEELVRLNAAHERMRLGLVQMMRMERDLRIARAIQQQTIPDRLPTFEGFEIAAWNEPADETGGDTYDVVSCRSDASGRVTFVEERAGEADHVIMMLADATGHGIGPALSVTQVRSMLRMALRMGAKFDEVVHRLNSQLVQDLSDGRFVTAWFGLLDVRSGALTSLSAGQGPILRFQAEDAQVEVLSADTVPLGVMEDLTFPPREPWMLRPGDLVAIVSDGIFEATNPAGEQFGVERVSDLLRSGAAHSAESIAAALREAVDQFAEGRGRADDATVIIVRCTP